MGKALILLIDPSAVTRSMYADCFRHHGYEVVEADDAAVPPAGVDADVALAKPVSPRHLLLQVNALLTHGRSGTSAA